MPLLAWIVLFTLLGGVLSVLAAALFLLTPDRHRSRLLPHGVSFALGALLSVAFIDLLPHALESAGPAGSESLFATVLTGILSFFLLEKLLLWRHCHTSDCEAHFDMDEHFHQPAGTLIVVGDGIHNFVDGVLIAAAFLTDIHLGVVTALAVAAHEIPQEVGDFAILLQSGCTRSKALLFNMLSSLGTLIGGLLAYFSLESLHGALPYILALAASSFIYVSVADLIPTLHKKTHPEAVVQQMTLILAGVLLIATVHHYAHDFQPPVTREPVAHP
ncbi:ZIP family metal transporter [Methylococcus sp. EFPC2]|uniref:ZIP family metal transporter n=1 Tax=Methylococcus sp. EFPC2 TaxID=2812648 RepID=UPI0019671BD1|nr:ZIP family metal transporter [Methylococcus sp. EFPC2]QSA96094.1 ZIP family metal transporter [Methylococcus sp. EFPC2]